MAHFAAACSAAAAAASGDSGDAFWTVCPHCCYVHSYQRIYLSRHLRCPTPTCRRAFSADELPSAPPVVPGTDMYFCTWVFFPLGPPSVPDGWTPFTPFNPASPPSPSPAPAPAAAAAPASATPVAAMPIRVRPSSTKKVRVCLKGRARAEAEEEEAADSLEAEALEIEEKGCTRININETIELGELGFREDELRFLVEMP